MSSAREPDPPRSPEEFQQLLGKAAPSFGLELPGPTLDSLAAYLTELDSWRRRINLTGRLTPQELAAHALESVLGAGLIPENSKVVDVGSGAGLPGLPIAIAREDLEVTLVEPRQKRCAFLRHVVRTLGLPRVQVVEARIEDVRGQAFDVATTRAVGIPHLAFCEVLKRGGLLICWTTEPLASDIVERFRLQDRLLIPGSRRRVIASFRRS